MPRILNLGAATAIAAASVILTVPSSGAAPLAGPDARPKVRTEFAMKATGYGTRIDGGALPASSGTTAYQTIGCTNKAGLSRRNDVAAVELPGLGNVDGVRTRVNTFTNKKLGRTSVVSQHDVARIKLAGQLSIGAVTSKATVWHDKSGFHQKVETTIGRIAVGNREFPIPTPNVPLTIPGVATISLGDHHGSATKSGAYAAGNAIKILVKPTNTVVRVAHSAARIDRGVKVGRFRGQAHGTQVEALDANVRSGPLPLSYMPCQGTEGKVKEKSVVGLDLADQIVVGAVRNRQMGKQTKKKATGFEESAVASVKLGPLTINAVKARANVTRLANGKVQRNALGTTLGSAELNGEEYALPALGTLEIPGVGLVRIETNVIKKSARGIAVTALRITLLEGTLATVNLANARLEIKPSGVAK